MNKLLFIALFCICSACGSEDIGVGLDIDAPPKEVEEGPVNLAGKIKEVGFSQGETNAFYTFKYDSLGNKISEISIIRETEETVLKPIYGAGGFVESFQSNGQTFAKLLYESNRLIQFKTPTFTESYSYNQTNNFSNYRYDSQVERKIYDFKRAGNSLLQVILKGTVNNDESIIKENEQLNPLKDFFIGNLGVIPFNYLLINNYLIVEETLVFKGLTFKYDYQFEGKKLITIKKQSVQINNNLKTEEEIKIVYY